MMKDSGSYRVNCASCHHIIHDESLGCESRKRPTEMDGSCKFNDYEEWTEDTVM
jgi:hypothetical protein